MVPALFNTQDGHGKSVILPPTAPPKKFSGRATAAAEAEEEDRSVVI